MAQGRVGIRAYSGSTTTYDTDAQAFITAAALTDTGQKTAVNYLVLDLKTAGLWTKMKAIYPMVGGTATTHKWNLKDPRDLDAAFRLVFNGSWTHNASGATPTGGYADTKLNLLSNASATDFAMGFYQASNLLSGNMVHMSAGSSHELRTFSGQLTGAISGSYASSGSLYTSFKGLWIISKTSLNSTALYKPNGAIMYDTNTYASATMPSQNVWLGAREGAGFYDSRTYSFNFMSSGLTDNEMNTLNTIIGDYQFRLNRAINLSWSYLNDSTPFLANGMTYDSATYTYTSDGVNDYALLQQGVKSTKKMTMMAWINADQLNGWRKALIFPYGASSWQPPYSSYQIAANGTSLCVSFNVNTDFNTGTVYYPNATTNTWYYVVGTFNNGIIKMYVNGQLYTTKDVSSSGTSIIYTNHSQMLLGLNATYFLQEQWMGKIGNVEVYSEEYSATDILAKYNATSAAHVNTTTTTTTAAPTTTTTTTAAPTTTTTTTAAPTTTTTTTTAASGSLILNLDAGNISSYPGTGTTWTDLTNTYTGISLVNGALYNSDGGGNILLDGVNDYIDLGLIGVMPNKNKFTFNTVYRFDKSKGGNAIFSAGTNGDPSTDILFAHDGTSFFFQINNGSDGGGVANYAYTSNTWVNICVVYDGTQTGNANRLKVYFDGVQNTLTFGSYTVPASTPNYNYQSYLGKYVSFSGWDLKGNIAIARLHNYALSSTEVSSFYTSIQSRFVTPTTTTTTAAPTTTTTTTAAPTTTTTTTAAPTTTTTTTTAAPTTTTTTTTSGTVVYDTDAQAFITATGLTDTTQKIAINNLVNNLKTANIWTKMKALYPMVGGTVTTHQFNLKDPRDLDAAYRLVFTGGWVHSSTGALPNGTDTHADTKLVQSTAFSTNLSMHLSFYSRSTGGGTDIGLSKAFSQIGLYSLSFGGSPLTFGARVNFNSSPTAVVPTSLSGFFLGSRTSNTVTKSYRNDVLLNTSSIVASPLMTGSVFISARNAADSMGSKIVGRSTRECSFASIGDGLTDAEALALFNAVQSYQTALGRQV